MSICLYVHVAFCLFLYFFFFSSRRRHTRWPRDWSSDVCSSDLNRWVEAWHRGSLWLYALLPLTGLFRVIATMRRRYLRRFAQRKLPVPVLVVGKSSVGGTGQTRVIIAVVLDVGTRCYKPGGIRAG